MKELTSVYGMYVLKNTAVKKWAGHFRSGRDSVGDDSRASRPASACNVRNVKKVKQEIEKDRQKMIRDVADNTDILHMSAHKILR